MKSDYERILTEKVQLGPFPMEKLKRVDQPTTLITDNIKRFDQREEGFERAIRGVYGPIAQRESKRLGKTPIEAAEWYLSYNISKAVDGIVASSKAPIPEDQWILSRHIKRLGYFLRADIMGICRLPQYSVYSHDTKGNPIELNHQFAIVILVDQEYETMKASNGYDWISGSQNYLSYSISGFIGCIMANYIRRLGYPARSHHQPGYQLVVPPLLLLSGIGEICRMGIVLNPFLGTRFKASVVTTDMPLLPDKPVDFGLQKFCQQCNTCAIECPAKAISMGDKVIYNGYENWKLDVERCAKFRVINPNGALCGLCIKVCSWNKPKGWLHDTARLMAMHTPWLDKFLIKMDGIMGYRKQHKENKWWFDLEKVDGSLQIPRRK